MIRKAKTGDIPNLVMLNSQVQNLHVNLFPEVFRVTDTRLIEEWFSDILSRDNTCVLIAEENETALGYMTVRKLHKPEHLFKNETSCAYIDQVCIHHDHQRTGVFKALLEKAAKEAALWGMNRLELDVWTDNSVAVKSFEKSGFKTCNQKMSLNLDQ